MKLALKRIAYRKDYTIGKLFVDGVYLCDTLEDTTRIIKVMNKTCIPVGTYRIILNFSNRFQRIMPLLLNVPGFEGIRMHSGNSAEDTSGCPLVGKNTIIGKLTESRITFDKLFDILKGAKDEIWITIS